MKNKKKSLKAEQESCFSYYYKKNTNCPIKECRHWVDFAQSKNCSIVAASQGRRTLQQIGDIFGLTRMRVCQIEKSALKKLQKEIRKNKL